MIFQYDSLNSLMSNITRVLAMFLKKNDKIKMRVVLVD